jgi:hypothetical protein
MKNFFIDIISVAHRLGIDIKKRGDRYVGSCPLHVDEHPSFVLYPKTGSFYCYQCHEGGGVMQLVSLLVDNIKTWNDLLKWFSSDDISRIPIKYSPPIHKIDELLHTNQEVVLPESSLSTEPLFAELGIRYAKEGKMMGRYIIPVTLNKQLIAYEARDFHSFLIPKTLIQPTDVKIHSYLWNYDELLTGLPIIIVEGIKGAIAVISFGHSNVVSSFGARLSSDQIVLLLAKRPTEIIVSYDADIAGNQGAENAISQLLAWTKVSRIYLPENCDPWDINKDIWAECLQNREFIDNKNRQADFIERFKGANL